MKCYFHNDLEKSMIIYKITNLIDGKIYIGQTINRLKRRVNRLRYNILLKRAMKLYGIENFELSVIENCSDINELNEKEQFWISFYDSINNQKGYNLQSGGKNCRMHEYTKKMLSEKCSGWHHTEKAKQKIREASTGNKHWAYGKKFSSRHISNMSKGHMGHRPTKITKEKISRMHKGRIITWGDKISKSKCKITKEEVLVFLTKNPQISLKKILIHFGFKTSGPIMRLGGIKQLRKEAINTNGMICPLCGKLFKVINNTHLKYIHAMN